MDPPLVTKGIFKDYRGLCEGLSLFRFAFDVVLSRCVDIAS